MQILREPTPPPARDVGSAIEKAPRIYRAIAFHYKQSRIPILRDVLKASISNAYHIHTVITTNEANASDLSQLIEEFSIKYDTLIEVVVFPNLSNPWLLTWAHKQLISTAFFSGSYDYFIYSEDDIRLSEFNILSWIDLSNSLTNECGLYPSFARVEYCKRTFRWFYTDQMVKLSRNLTPFVEVTFQHQKLGLYQLGNPYQAMYIYDKSLMKEYLLSPNFRLEDCKSISNIDHATWGGGGVAEESANGLTYVNPPHPFNSRNLMPIDLYTGLPHAGFLVHHMTNNYVENYTSIGFAHIGVDQLFSE